MVNVTFFTGAGASYHACPIWKEQGEKMVELAQNFLKRDSFPTFEHPNGLKNNTELLVYEIGYFGEKAIKYGTIDTYAKKLSLNPNDSKELQHLKLAVSAFFTVWHLTNDYNFKSRKASKEQDGKFLEIDQRYISLLAAIVEGKNGYDIKIKENIKFVTWNYDFQIEQAFKVFLGNDISWDSLSDNLSFRQGQENLQVCHLNGYHGFYNIIQNQNEPIKEGSLLDRTDLKSIKDILDSIDFAYIENSRKNITFSGHINYAWENNPIAESTRNSAMKIFSETDILVIIGYSFPNFNKEIDKILFRKLKDSTTIYFQDPNASKDYLKHLITAKDVKVEYLKDKLDSFHLPYEF